MKILLTILLIIGLTTAFRSKGPKHNRIFGKRGCKLGEICEKQCTYLKNKCNEDGNGEGQPPKDGTPVQGFWDKLGKKGKQIGKMMGKKFRGMLKKAQNKINRRKEMMKNKRKVEVCGYSKGKSKTYDKSECSMGMAMACEGVIPLHIGKCGNCTEENVCPMKTNIEKTMEKVVQLKQKMRKAKHPNNKRRLEETIKRMEKRMKINLMKAEKNHTICTTTPGVTFNHPCDFAMARCEAANRDEEIPQRKRRCTEKKEQKCKDVTEACKNPDVKMNKRSKKRKQSLKVCGIDEEGVNVTYTRSKCGFYKAMLCDNIKPLHKGQCGDCSEENICHELNMRKKKKANLQKKQKNLMRMSKWTAYIKTEITKLQIQIAERMEKQAQCFCDYQVKKCKAFQDGDEQPEKHDCKKEEEEEEEENEEDENTNEEANVEGDEGEY